MTLSGGGPEMEGPLHPFPQMSGITTPRHPHQVAIARRGDVLHTQITQILSLFFTSSRGVHLGILT